MITNLSEKLRNSKHKYININNSDLEAFYDLNRVIDDKIN